MSERRQGYGPTTIYLRGEQVEMARAISAQTGKSMARLFSECLTLLSAMEYPSTDKLAQILRRSEYGATLEETPLSSPNDDLAYRFDRWLSPESTNAVFLMGTTMARPIVGYATFWQRFLDGGKKLDILLQGELGKEEGKPIYTLLEEDRDNTIERRTRALEVLIELNKTAPEGSLHVKNSGDLLIPYSAVVVRRDKDEVDIQIYPYHFLPLKGFNDTAGFFVRTYFKSGIYELLTDPIIEFWSRAKPEVGFEPTTL